MKKLHLNLNEKSYDIIIEKDFHALPEYLKTVNAPKKLLIVTDTNVERLYGEEVCGLLCANGYDTRLTVFEAGESHKNIDTILSINKAMLDFGMDRKSMVLALGGGVVGDMAGFAASIYMRGISYVQIPTTLLSQSDSSVGGKTGIDFGGAKNILGAFHQPKLVYINVNTIKTLPEREFISGMGEVVKHGIIQNASFFDFLDKNHEQVRSMDENILETLTYENCSVKASVVENDERENGLRAILNFGHTIGHAVESAFDFTKTHGECVGLGILAAAFIAYKRGLLDKQSIDRIKNILEKYGFETAANLPDSSLITELMSKDKKKTDGKLKFVLPVSIGKVIITDDVTSEEISAALEYIRR